MISLVINDQALRVRCETAFVRVRAELMGFA